MNFEVDNKTFNGIMIIFIGVFCLMMYMFFNLGTGFIKDKNAIVDYVNEHPQVLDSLITYNENPVFEDGNSLGNLEFNNSQQDLVQVEIYEKNTGRLIYKNDRVIPGYLEKDKLLVDLDKGNYPCVVKMTVLYNEKKSAQYSASKEMYITVKN